MGACEEARSSRTSPEESLKAKLRAKLVSACQDGRLPDIFENLPPAEFPKEAPLNVDAIAAHHVKHYSGASESDESLERTAIRCFVLHEHAETGRSFWPFKPLSGLY